MKVKIHPQWYPEAEIVCACGNIFKVGSTKPNLRVEICHKCHPFFTGEMKFVDTMGRVEKFQKLQKKAAAANYVSKKKKKQEKKIAEDRSPKSLREMLMGNQ
jgi:large subunit ribosomal protein L31